MQLPKDIDPNSGDKNMYLNYMHNFKPLWIVKNVYPINIMISISVSKLIEVGCFMTISSQKK